MKCSHEYICVADAVENIVYTRNRRNDAAHSRRKGVDVQHSNSVLLFLMSLTISRERIEKVYIHTGERERELYIYFRFICNRYKIGGYKFCIFYSGTFISRGAYPFLIMRPSYYRFQHGEKTLSKRCLGKRKMISFPVDRCGARAIRFDSIRERVRTECCSRYARIGINDRTSGE